MRNAEELSITITPAAANFGASAFDDVAPAENRAMSRPDGSAVSASSTMISLALPRQGGAGRPGRREVADLVDREPPLGEQATHHATDLTSCTNDSDAHGRPG